MNTKFFKSSVNVAVAAVGLLGAACVAEVGGDPDAVRPIVTPIPGPSRTNDRTRASDSSTAAAPAPISVEIRGLGRKTSTVGTSINFANLSFHIESVRGFGEDLDSSGEDLGGMTFGSLDGEPEFESPREGGFSGALKQVKRVGIDFTPSQATLDDKASSGQLNSPGASIVLRGIFSFPRPRRSKPSHPTPSPSHPTPSPSHERSELGDIESLPFEFRDASAIAVRATLDQLTTGDVRQIVIVIDLDKLVDPLLFDLFGRAANEASATELVVSAESAGNTLTLFDGLRERFSTAISIELR